MKINKYQSKKKPLVFIAIAVLFASAMYFAVAAANHLPPFTTTDTTYQPGEQVTNLERSDTEKETEDRLNNNPEQKLKNNQTDAPEPPTETSTGKASVNVLVTSAGITNGTVSASGMVTNIVEEGGSCTYVFVSGTSTVTKTAQTLTNPTSTTCATVRFPVSELSADGSWRVSLSYTSASASGKSSEKEFTK